MPLGLRCAFTAISLAYSYCVDAPAASYHGHMWRLVKSWGSARPRCTATPAGKQSLAKSHPPAWWSSAKSSLHDI